MPVKVVKRGNQWCTVDAQGKVHGCSNSRAKAMISASMINAAVRKKEKRG